MSSIQPDPQPRPRTSDTETPTWTRDFLRVLGLSLIGVLFATILVWAATAGLLREKNSFDRLEGDPLWAGICAGGMVFLFPFLFFEHERQDSGFRRKGFVPLVMLSVPCGAVVATAVMMTWPFVLGDEAIPGTVSGDLAGDPASLLLILLFSIGGMSWCTSVLMTMIIGGFKAALWLIVPYLGCAFFFLLTAPRIFENPAGPSSIIFWAAVALSGLAVLTVLASLRNVIDKPEGRTLTTAERDAAYQRYMDDRRRRGLTNETLLPGIDGRQPGPPSSYRPGPPQRSQYPPQR